jgi:hypothetical protein
MSIAFVKILAIRFEILPVPFRLLLMKAKLLPVL